MVLVTVILGVACVALARALKPEGHTIKPRVPKTKGSAKPDEEAGDAMPEPFEQYLERIRKEMSDMTGPPDAK
jgi:hypothetical protein